MEWALCLNRSGAKRDRGPKFLKEEGDNGQNMEKGRKGESRTWGRSALKNETQLAPSLGLGGMLTITPREKRNNSFKGRRKNDYSRRDQIWLAIEDKARVNDGKGGDS